MELKIDQTKCEYCKACIQEFPEYLEYRGKKKLKVCFKKNKDVFQKDVNRLFNLCPFGAIVYKNRFE